MDVFYIGVDLHPHQQTVSWCDLQTGEIRIEMLLHNTPAVRAFYASMPKAVVGIEASTQAVWFEALLSELGHQLLVGHPAAIRARARSRHKSDKRDAELLLDLLRKGEFPALWRRDAGSQQVLDILQLRNRFVRQRTQTYNRLQALAHSCGLAKGRVKNRAFQEALLNCEVNEAQNLLRRQLFNLLTQLDLQIAELETLLEQKAEANTQVKLLRTQKGVGYLTALAVVHTLGDVERFPRLSKQVVAFAGLDPLEKSSGGKVKFGGISKQGNWLLRFLLGQAAHLAARHDGRLKSFYKKLAKKKAKSVAKTAVARKLLIKLAIMLRDKITAEEFDQRGRTVGDARKGHGLR
jgi:transposase